MVQLLKKVNLFLQTQMALGEALIAAEAAAGFTAPLAEITVGAGVFFVVS